MLNYESIFFSVLMAKTYNIQPIYYTFKLQSVDSNKLYIRYIK